MELGTSLQSFSGRYRRLALEDPVIVYPLIVIVDLILIGISFPEADFVLVTISELGKVSASRT